MDITVAICTWNRAKLLDQTLAEMHKLHVPAGIQWEILVVNNNSPDDTDAVIAKHATALPIRRLFEPKQGHSHARNCAVAEAQGDLIIWTDDDVLVTADWLATYYEVARQWPEAVYFGGAVDPLYAMTPPSWVGSDPRLIEGPYALRQYGPEVRPFRDSETPVGASMAFRSSVLKSARFDPTLGRVGADLISGDETELLESIKRRGMAGIWIGRARLRHYVPAERLTTRYIWNWWVGMGVTEVRQYGLPKGAYWFNMPRWAMREYLVSQLQLWLLGAWKGAAWAKAMRRGATSLGYLREARRLRKVQSACPASSQRVVGTA